MLLFFSVVCICLQDLITDNIYEYNQILNELTSVYLSIDPNYSIVGGDFNIDFRRPGVCQESIQILYLHIIFHVV